MVFREERIKGGKTLRCIRFSVGDPAAFCHDPLWMAPRLVPGNFTMVCDADQSCHHNGRTLYINVGGHPAKEAIFTHGRTGIVYQYFCSSGHIHNHWNLVQGTQLGVFLVA